MYRYGMDFSEYLLLRLTITFFFFFGLTTELGEDRVNHT